jgi:hypothetical protein
MSVFACSLKDRLQFIDKSVLVAKGYFIQECYCEGVHMANSREGINVQY